MNFDARQKVILVRIELKGGKRIGLTTKSKKNEDTLHVAQKECCWRRGFWQGSYYFVCAHYDQPFHGLKRILCPRFPGIAQLGWIFGTPGSFQKVAEDPCISQCK